MFGKILMMNVSSVKWRSLLCLTFVIHFEVCVIAIVLCDVNIRWFRRLGIFPIWVAVIWEGIQSNTPLVILIIWNLAGKNTMIRLGIFQATWNSVFYIPRLSRCILLLKRTRRERCFVPLILILSSYFGCHTYQRFRHFFFFFRYNQLKHFCLK